MRSKEELILKLYLDTKEAEKSLKKLKRELKKTQTEPMTEGKLAKAAEVYNRGVVPLRNLQKQAQKLQEYGVKNKFVDSLAKMDTSLKISEKEGKVVTNSLTRQFNKVKNSMTTLDKVTLKAGKTFRTFEFGMFSVMFSGWMLKAVLGRLVSDMLGFYQTVVGGNSALGISLMGLTAKWNYMKFKIGEAIAKILDSLKPFIEWLTKVIDKHSNLVGTVLVAGLALATFALILGQGYMALKAVAGGVMVVAKALDVLKLAVFENPITAVFALLGLLISYVIYQILKFKMTWKGAAKYIINEFVNAFAILPAFIGYVLNKVIIGKLVGLIKKLRWILNTLGFKEDAKVLDKIITPLERQSKMGLGDMVKLYSGIYRGAINKVTGGWLTMGRESFQTEAAWRSFYVTGKGYVMSPPASNTSLPQININVNNPQLISHDQIVDLAREIGKGMEEGVKEMKFSY